MLNEYLSVLIKSFVELGVLGVLISLSVVVLRFISDLLFLGNLFRKAGYKRYISIIPYYNTFTLTLLATGSESWAIIGGLPGLRYIALIYALIKLFPSYGKSVFFGICSLILPLYPIFVIGYAITALDNSHYIGPAPGWDTDDDEDEEEFDEPVPKPQKKVVKKKVVKKVKK